MEVKDVSDYCPRRHLRMFVLMFGKLRSDLEMCPAATTCLIEYHGIFFTVSVLAINKYQEHFTNSFEMIRMYIKMFPMFLF